MSENITHIAATEDCFHFVGILDKFSPEFKQVTQNYVRLSRLTSVTRGGDRFSVTLLDQIRAEFRKGNFDEFQQRKLAFALGWICHRAADRCMKPVFGSFDSKTLRSAVGIDYTASDCSIYNDATIYKLYHANNNEGPYPKATFEELMESLPEHEDVDILGVRALSRVLIQNSLLAMQEVAVEDGEFDAWLKQINVKRQRFTLEVERYYGAIFNPNPEKYNKFIVEANFYDGSEPILQMAMKMRTGDKVSSNLLQDAILTKPESSYAHILNTASRYLEVANEFFTGDMGVDELRDRLDIGKMGRDGIPA